MPFVSAKYAQVDPNMPPAGEGQKMVVATDHTGMEWWLTEDSQVGDWLRYLEEGGTIDPADPQE